MKNEIAKRRLNKTVGAMAATYNNSNSVSLPLRYGVASRLLAKNPALRTITWEEALELYVVI
mgnify:CR=1 FL=1